MEARDTLVGELFTKIADAVGELSRDQLALIHESLEEASIPILETSDD